MLFANLVSVYLITHSQFMAPLQLQILVPFGYYWGVWGRVQGQGCEIKPATVSG